MTSNINPMVVRMEVNKYHVPDFRLDPDLIDATKLLYDKYRNEEANDNLTISNLLGHKSPSGSYFRKLAALRDFGLLEKRGVKVTNLGIRITYPTSDDEKNSALNEAILNIPLWKEFFKQYGVNLPKEKFWVDLQRIAGIAAPDAQNLENSVRNAYLNDVRNLKIVECPEKPTESDKTQTSINGSNDKKPTMEVTQTKSSGISPINMGGDFPILYDPELGASIVIDTPRKFKVAKIFWEAIEARWIEQPKSDITKSDITTSKNQTDEKFTYQSNE
jgi:hypothetical protein